MNDRRAQLESLSIDRDSESTRSGLSVGATAVIALIAAGAAAGGTWYVMRGQTPAPAPVREAPVTPAPAPAYE